MHEFKISQNGLKKIRKQLLIMIIPFLFIAEIGGLAFSLIDSKERTTTLSVLPITIIIIGLVSVWALNRGLRYQKELFASYKLTITDNLISREQLNLVSVSIYIGHVTEIIKNDQGRITIKGNQVKDKIIIPAEVDNQDQLEKILNGILPITMKP